jgi:hypothetical protein
MRKGKTITLSEAKSLLLDVLNARENGRIKTDQVMIDQIHHILDDPNIYAALFKGDDPKSWYAPLSVWKKAKFDEAYKSWQQK